MQSATFAAQDPEGGKHEHTEISVWKSDEEKTNSHGRCPAVSLLRNQFRGAAALAFKNYRYAKYPTPVDALRILVRFRLRLSLLTTKPLGITQESFTSFRCSASCTRQHPHPSGWNARKIYSRLCARLLAER